MKPERMARKIIYQSPWVNLYLDKVKFPAGRIIDEYHLLNFDTEAVAAVIVNEKQQILMIEAYRYPTDSIEWEIPSGGIDQGETVLEAAKREAFEETGYEVGDLEPVYSFYPSNGNSNQRFHVVYCKAVRKLSETYDLNEVKGFRWFGLDDIRRMIKNRELNDGFTLTALLLYLTAAAADAD